MARVRPGSAGRGCMRILMIAPHPYYIDRGTPIDVDLLLRALSTRGDSVDLVCYAEGETRAYKGLRIYRARDLKWLRGMRPGFSGRKLVADLFLAVRVFGRLRRGRYDVIHVGEEAVFLALLLKRLYRLPYVYDMDSSVAQQLVEQMPWLRPFSRLFNHLESCALRSSLAVAPVCNALGAFAERAGAQHIEILHDISQLDNPALEPRGLLRRQWGITAPALLYVGNLQSYQGVDLLLAAFARAVEGGSRLDLVVVGGHPDDVASYQEKAERLGVESRTHWVGTWPASRLGELLVDAEILVTPRIKGVNTPMKIFPYLHSGRPLLATNLPTHTQILGPDVTVLAEPNPDAFAEAILRLEHDDALRRRVGRNGRRFVEQDHTFDAHLRRVERLYAYVKSQLDLAMRADDEAGRRAPQARTVTLSNLLKMLPIDLGQGNVRYTTKGKKIGLALIADGHGLTALDLGCREGAQSRWLRARGYRVVSVDLAPLCKPAVQADANVRLPFGDAQFDLIWCSEVVEHLQDPQRFRIEIERLLKPGGKLVLTTPNSAFWLYPVARLFGKSPRELQNPDHKHFFDKAQIRRLFPDARLFGFFPYFLLKARIKRGIGALSPTFVVEYTRPVLQRQESGSLVASDPLEAEMLRNRSLN